MTIKQQFKTDRNHHTMITEGNKIDQTLHTQEIIPRLDDKEATTMNIDRVAGVQALATIAINQDT